jgi:adenylate cyclase
VEERSVRKLAVILHADVVGSTLLVHRNETLSHDRIRDAFRRLSESVKAYGGTTQEIRGDALVAEFGRASDAVSAALSFQTSNVEYNATLEDDICPRLRIGISMGEVVVADHTVTGAGVVLAQRLEQLTEPDGVCIQGAVYETLPKRLPFDYENLGDQELKGFEEPVRAFKVSLKPDETVPVPEHSGVAVALGSKRPKNRRIVLGVGALLILVAGGLAWWQPWRPELEPASPERLDFSLPDKPSIAVLPFNNMSDDPKQEYFVDGITEDLITDLSKLSGLFVIARNSTFAYKGKSPDVRRVAEELGIRYVVEGSVRRSGDQMRINAQLVDAATGEEIWAERYDGTLIDVFGLQDKVTGKIVAALAVSLTTEELSHRSAEETDSPQAYDAFLQGWELYRRFSADNFKQAIPHFERAIQLDPNYGRAYAALASIYWESIRQGESWTLKLLPERLDHESFLVAREKAEKYLELAMKKPSPLAHRVRSAMYWDYRQFVDAIAEAERAIALDPNDPEGYVALAWALNFSGQSELAVAAVDKAMRLDPRHPGAYLYILGMNWFGMGQYDRAVTALQRARERTPENRVLNVPLAAAYAKAGRLDDARNALKRYMDVWASYTSTVDSVMGWWPFRREADIRRFGEALVKAGLCCADHLEQYIERVREGGTLQ